MAANHKGKSKSIHNRKRAARRFPAPLLLVLGGLLLAGAGMVWLLGGREGKGGQTPVEVRGQPSLKVDREKLDFGEVEFDQPVTADFTLTNVGDQPLRFTKPPYIEVAAGC